MTFDMVTAPKPRLRDVEARAEAATEGPWRSGKDWIMGAPSPSAVTLIAVTKGDGPQYPDATFIAASRTDVPALTAAIRAVLDLARDADRGMPEIRGMVHGDDIRAALSAHIDLEES